MEITSHFSNTSSPLTRGFTLIELLVVIAIIGILASVVLASLNSARDKGGDAAVKSNLNNIRPQAALSYSTNGSYTSPDVCTDAVVARALAAAINEGGGTGECNRNAGDYAVWVPLKSAPTTAWCVDGRGASKSITTPALTTAHVFCP